MGALVLSIHGFDDRGWQCLGEPGGLKAGCCQMECSTNLKGSAHQCSEYRIARGNVGHSLNLNFQESTNKFGTLG